MSKLNILSKKSKTVIAKNSTEKLHNRLYWKKEFTKILNEDSKFDSTLSDNEIKLRKEYIEEKLAESESDMIDINKGMYLGIGYALNQESSPKAEPIYAKWAKLNNHVGFKGTTRVGKTVNMLGHIDQCIAKGMDVIVIDPKGAERQEVLSSCAESAFAHGRSEDFFYFSPSFPSLSHRMNLLYGKTNIEVASMIVDSISEPGMESFYLEIATRVLLAITSALEYLQAVTDPTGLIAKYLEEEEIIKYMQFSSRMANGNTGTYYNEDDETEVKLRQADYLDMLGIEHDSSEELTELAEIGFNRTLLNYEDLELYCSYSGLEKLLALVTSMPMNKHSKFSTKNVPKLKKEAVRILSSALATDEKHFSKVSDSLSNRLLQLSTGPIGEMLCSTRINPLSNRLLNKKKGVVAVVQPAPMKYKKSADMLNKTLLGMLDSMMGTVGVEGRKLPRRIALFIDEAGAVCYPGIQNFFNRAGGLGITCFVYTQSDEDYNNALGETLANVVIDNVNTAAIMRQNLTKSCEDAAASIGTFTSHKTIAMISAGGGEGRYSSDTTEEYLCKPSDIAEMPMGEGVLRHNGKVYYMEFPFRLPPRGAFKMPELETEKATRHLVEFENKLSELSAANMVSFQNERYSLEENLIN